MNGGGLAFDMDRINARAAGVVVGVKGTLVGIGVEEVGKGSGVVIVRPQMLVDAAVARQLAAALVEAANEVDQGLRRDAAMRGPAAPSTGGPVGTGSRRSGGSGGFT